MGKGDDKGRRLSTLVNRIWMSHSMNPIRPVREDALKSELDVRVDEDSNSDASDQGRLWEVDWKHVKLGYFFELMTAGMYGGLLGEDMEVVGYEGLMGVDPGTGLIGVYPDVYDARRKLAFESKGCFSSESLNLEDDQIDRYKAFLYAQEGSQLYYAIYRHSFGKIRSYQGDAKMLFSSLSSNTLCSLVLPFSIVLALHETRDDNLAWRYDGELWTLNTSIKARTFTRFLEGSSFQGAKDVLRDLRLDPNDYVIEKLMSPIGFCVEGNRIRQFPVLSVIERDNPIGAKSFFELMNPDLYVEDDSSDIPF